MQSADEFAAKLVAAERELVALTAEVKRNDDKLRRSQRRELQLLQAPSLGALFHEMIDGLENSYGLEYVSVTLRDPSHDIRHLLHSGRAPMPPRRSWQLEPSASALSLAFWANAGSVAVCTKLVVPRKASAVADRALASATN